MNNIPNIKTVKGHGYFVIEIATRFEFLSYLQ